MGADMLEYTPELAASLLAPAERACSLGVTVERLRVKSFRRVDALVEVASERNVRLARARPGPHQGGQAALQQGRHGRRAIGSTASVWVTWDLPLS